jgi:hypothetical protein
MILHLEVGAIIHWEEVGILHLEEGTIRQAEMQGAGMTSQRIKPSLSNAPVLQPWDETR